MRIMERFVLCLAVFLLLTPYSVLPQKSERPASTHSDSDQVLQEILNEMRFLRAELRRTTVNIHRSQVLIERIRTPARPVSCRTPEGSPIDSTLRPSRAPDPGGVTYR